MTTEPGGDEIYPSLEAITQEATDGYETIVAVIEEVGEEAFVQGLTRKMLSPDTTTEELIEAQALLLICAEHAERDDLAEHHLVSLIRNLRADKRYGVSAFAASFLFGLQLEADKPSEAATTLIEGYSDCLLFEAGEDSNETLALSTEIREHLARSFYEAPTIMADYLRDKPELLARVIEYCEVQAIETVDMEKEAFARNILVAIFNAMEDYEEVEQQAEQLETLSVRRGRLAEAILMGANVARIAIMKDDTTKAIATIGRLKQYRAAALQDPDTDSETARRIDEEIAELTTSLDRHY